MQNNPKHFDTNTNIFEFPNRRAEREFLLEAVKEWARSNFRDRQEMHRHFPAETHQTICNWWSGKNVASGFPLICAAPFITEKYEREYRAVSLLK